MSRSKILHSYNDVTLADNELQTLGVCSLPMALIKKEESVPTYCDKGPGVFSVLIQQITPIYLSFTLSNMDCVKRYPINQSIKQGVLRNYFYPNFHGTSRRKH